MRHKVIMVDITSLANLDTNGWFASASPGLRSVILEAGRLQELDQGEQVQRIGDIRVGPWGVIQGQVGINGINGPSVSTSFFYQPGDWGGYGPLLGYPRIADAFARTQTVILLVPYVPLHQALTENPAWWRDIARMALHDVKRYSVWGNDLLHPSSSRRTAAILLHLSGVRTSGDACFPVVASQGELAEMANLSRSSFNKIISDFEDQGMIACSYRQIQVLNAPTLRRLADEL